VSASVGKAAPFDIDGEVAVNPEYRDYFASTYEGEDLREQFGVFPPDELDATLRNLIAAADDRLHEERGVRLRADAKLFLLVNFRELIVRPLDVMGSPAEREELRSVLAGDIRRVALAAADSGDTDYPVRSRDPKEPDGISSHAVVNGLARNWDQVASLRPGFWNRYR